MTRTVFHLKASYRDQLIRELQVLQRAPGIAFSPEVDKQMAAFAMRQELVEPGIRWWQWRRKSSINQDSLVASDLYLLEAHLIERLGYDDLRLRIVGFRDMLSHMLTADSFHAMEGQFHDLSDRNIHKQVLVAEAKALISRIYRRYEGVPAVENIRASVAKKILLVTAVLSVFVLVFVRYRLAPMVLAVGAFGALGSAISTMGRLYAFDPRHEPFKTWLAIESGKHTLLLAPLIGFVFAVVVFMLIRGGVLQGALFPHFDCWSLLTIDVSRCPDTGYADIAKLLGWGFLAGWAERLVPDILDRLAPQATSNWKAK